MVMILRETDQFIKNRQKCEEVTLGVTLGHMGLKLEHFCMGQV